MSILFSCLLLLINFLSNLWRTIWKDRPDTVVFIVWWGAKEWLPYFVEDLTALTALMVCEFHRVSTTLFWILSCYQSKGFKNDEEVCIVWMYYSGSILHHADWPAWCDVIVRPSRATYSYRTSLFSVPSLSKDWIWLVCQLLQLRL